MRKWLRKLRLAFILISGSWLLLAVNPQVYIYLLMKPYHIVLYMDILDVDEDIFYYYKSNENRGEAERVVQEEVKRDGVKKGKSFLKSKAAQIIATIDAEWIIFAALTMYFRNAENKPLLFMPFIKALFHPPKQ